MLHTGQGVESYEGLSVDITIPPGQSQQAKDNGGNYLK
jgi:hypothetical protein